jgi:hypothetical protein
MGFVIEMNHKKHAGRQYICAVPTTTPNDYENTAVETLEEASRYPYPTEEVAALVVTSFPPTKNVIYRVIAVDEAAAARAGN